MNNIDKKLAALQLERVIGYLGRQRAEDHKATMALCDAIVILSNARVHIWDNDYSKKIVLCAYDQRFVLVDKDFQGKAYCDECSN